MRYGPVNRVQQTERRIKWRDYEPIVPVPVAARSKTYVFIRSPAEIVGSNPTGAMDVLLL